MTAVQSVIPGSGGTVVIVYADGERRTLDDETVQQVGLIARVNRTAQGAVDHSAKAEQLIADADRERDGGLPFVRHKRESAKVHTNLAIVQELRNLVEAFRCNNCPIEYQTTDHYAPVHTITPTGDRL